MHFAFICFYLVMVMALYSDHLARLEELHFTEFISLYDCALEWAPKEIYMGFGRQK